MTDKPFAIGDRVVTGDRVVMSREWRNRAGVVVEVDRDDGSPRVALFATEHRESDLVWMSSKEVHHDR